MELIYPINFIGYDDWVRSGYDLNLSQGDVITRDGEVIGGWRVASYDSDDEHSSGRFEFTPLGEENAIKIVEGFAMLDVRMSRGLALSSLTKKVADWYEAKNPENSE